MKRRNAPARPLRQVLVVLSALAAAAALSVGPAVGRAAAQTLTDSVTVNATSGLGTIPSDAVGLNTAVYDGYMNDGPVTGLLKAAGVDAMRYPGGSYSDIYNWQSNTAQGGYVAPNTSFSSFMTTAKAVGAEPIITVNYGTGTPALAAAWVSNAASNSDGVKYWEVGNEVYGNGTYGANWEADSHCTTSPSGGPVTIGSEPSQTYNCGPAVYAANVAQYISAMHAASANAKVCAILTTPGFWPDGVTNSQTSPQPWNRTVLTALGTSTQCVIVHYYPGGSSAAGMLTDPTDIAGIVSTLRSQLSQYAGIGNPASVPIPGDRDQLHHRHGHPAGRPVRRRHVPDLAGERRHQRRLVERAQRGRHDQHGQRRDRLRRPGHPLQRVEQ